MPISSRPGPSINWSGTQARLQERHTFQQQQNTLLVDSLWSCSRQLQTRCILLLGYSHFTAAKPWQEIAGPAAQRKQVLLYPAPYMHMAQA